MKKNIDTTHVKGNGKKVSKKKRSAKRSGASGRSKNKNATTDTTSKKK